MHHAATHEPQRAAPPRHRKLERVLRSTRHPELASILARHNGLTSVEIRGLATKWKCHPEAITRLVAEWGYPILAQRRRPAFEPDHQPSPTPGQASEAFAIIGDEADVTAELAALRKELDAAREEVEEAHRIQQIAEREIAQARAEVLRTKELRMASVKERAALVEQGQRIEALERALDEAVTALQRPFREQLRGIRSDDLSAMFEDWLRELERRRRGGRQTRLGRTTVYG